MRENVDIRLKSANVESAPDENVLIGGAASIIIMLLDGVGMIMWGDFARLNETEKQLITDPLNRVLSKLTPANLNVIGKYGDPILLIMGLMAWVSRVTMENKRREKAKAEPPKTEPEPIALNPEPQKSVNTIETNPPDEIIKNFEAAENVL